MMNGARAIYWARRDLGNAAVNILGPNLAVAGALCEAYRDGFKERKHFNDGDDRLWVPGCGRPIR